ncbi:MAG: hypothetical protein KDJ18_00130, partial [Hyphomicrobiaceae bacterium]|nr:hypothetical protein [Hyphomicrobiaceae bacterium]
MTALYRYIAGLLIAALVLAGLLPASSARAQDEQNLFSPGDAVVTGFSGIQPNGALLIPGMSPLDQFFINTEGASAQILSMGALGEPPRGQLVTPMVRKPIPASEIGQVFPIALMENADNKSPPAILLGATSMFGLHIVKPDSNGDGVAERIRTGDAGAFWMPGMFADDKGGSPGAIWRVDGVSGDVTLFATIPDNSGPGLGDVVFDKASRQVFVSDLDSGLIHRLDENGQPIDTFDHGVSGRPAKGLVPVSDDGKKADIESNTFDVEKPDTWGLTQVERRVHGMAMHEGRLYYTADHKVWSIGIKTDGGFAGDPRWELDVAASKPDTQLSDMLFDKSGRMYVAERAAQRGSYDYSEFAEPTSAEVKRYRLESPDNPATPSRWVPDPETYAIGLPADHRHSNGGITLGFPYDETGLRTNACGEFLWTTGERLRTGEFAQGDAAGDPAANADVHGLQGNPVDLVRPQNVPPTTSYFTDYDNFFGDAEKAGHMGDVEIWQPCDAKVGELPPWGEPVTEEPPDYPPEFPEPERPFHTNLELRKYADPHSCWRWGANWVCRYTIRITNTGPDDYFGDMQIRDVFPADPPGLVTHLEPQPPWFCWQPGGSAAETRCWRPDVFLAAGDSLFMTVWAGVPADQRRCRLTNIAEIEWAPGGSSWNTDPTDDIDEATAVIPDPECRPDGQESDLELKKTFDNCSIFDGRINCGFHITVENLGPGIYDGPIVVRDTMPAGVSFDWASVVDWNCGNVGGNTFECTLLPAAISPMGPGDMVHLWVWASIPIADARQYQCRIPNRAWIASPLGAPSNTDATNDADDATAQLPEELCRNTQTNLRIDKAPYNATCGFNGIEFFCGYKVRVTNTGPGPYNGPIDVRDTAPAGTTILMGPATDPWACGPQAGTTRDCHLPNANLPAPGSFTEFVVALQVPRAIARDNQCQIRNRADIVSPLGPPSNTNGADDTSNGIATIPGEFCDDPPPPPPPPPP